MHTATNTVSLRVGPTVPQKFPELAFISFTCRPSGAVDSHDHFEFLYVEHVMNSKLRIRRWFSTRDVRAVFVPSDPAHVDHSCGHWFLGNEVFSALPTALENGDGSIRGIVYVPEHARTLMQVEVGMTAAESVEYYPPLPDDRTADHYQFDQARELESSVGGPSYRPSWDNRQMDGIGRFFDCSPLDGGGGARFFDCSPVDRDVDACFFDCSPLDRKLDSRFFDCSAHESAGPSADDPNAPPASWRMW